MNRPPVGCLRLPAGWRLKARTAAARRARHEAGADEACACPDPLDALSFGEVRAAVAEEVDRLPDELRAPLVLCYWQGDSQPVAAARLGCSLSTLKRRLDTGRDRLAARLARRGFASAAVFATLTAVASQAGRSAVGPLLAPICVRPAVPTVLSAPVLRMLAVASIMIAGVAIGLSPAEDGKVPPRTKPVETAALPAKPVDAFGDPLPPGAVARLGSMRFRTADFPKHLAISPDGKQIVSTAHFHHVRLAIWEADTGRLIREVDMPTYPESEAICWPADGRGRAAIKVGKKDYVIWEFTDPKAKVPSGEPANSIGIGSFSASAFSPDGTLIAGGERAGPQCTAGKLQVWPVHPGRPVREAAPRFTVDTADGFVALMFTHDGKRLIGITQGRQPNGVIPGVPGGPPPRVEQGAAADTARVRVWDVATGHEGPGFEIPAGGFRIELSSEPTRRALSPDGKTLYTSTRNAHVKAFDLATGKERFDALAFGPLGEVTKKLLPGFTSQVGELAVTPDGRTVIVAETMGRTTGLDAATGKILWRGGREIDQLYGLAVFPDGKRFILGHGTRQIGVYDSATGKPLVEPIGPRGGLVTVGLAADGRTAVTGGWDNTLYRWDMANGRLIGRVRSPSAGFGRIGSISPDGLRAVGHDGVIAVATGQVTVPLGEPGVPQYSVAPGRVAWLRDGSLVVAAQENTATRYSAEGKKLCEYQVALPGKPRTGPQIAGVAIAPDGKTVVLTGEAAATHGGMLRSDTGWVAVFDAATGAKLRELQSKGNGGFSSAAFLPDGSRVILGRRVSQPPMTRIDQPPAALDLGAAIVVFDPATGFAITPFDAPDVLAHDRWVKSIAASPTGAQFAAVEWDDSITMYETASGAIRRRLKGHRGPVNQVAFTPDGGRLVSVSEDGTGLVWDTSPPRPTGKFTTSAVERAKRWAALLSTDDTAAYRAMGELAADPAGTVAFLKAHLKSTPAPTDADVDRLLAGLAASKFADREAAARNLDALGVLAVPKVRDRLPKVNSAEVKSASTSSSSSTIGLVGRAATGSAKFGPWSCWRQSEHQRLGRYSPDWPAGKSRLPKQQPPRRAALGPGSQTRPLMSATERRSSATTAVASSPRVETEARPHCTASRRR